MELNHLEIQFLVLNDFRLFVPVEELEAYGTMLVEFYVREVIATQQARLLETTGVTAAAAAAAAAATGGSAVAAGPGNGGGGGGGAAAAAPDVPMVVAGGMQSPTPP